MSLYDFAIQFTLYWNLVLRTSSLVQRSNFSFETIVQFFDYQIEVTTEIKVERSFSHEQSKVSIP